MVTRSSGLVGVLALSGLVACAAREAASGEAAGASQSPRPAASPEVPVQESHRIDEQAVDRARFEAAIRGLEVAKTPEYLAPLVEPDGGYGGTEAGYAARDPQTGARWLLTVVEAPGGHVGRTLSARPGELLRYEVEQGLWGKETLVVLVDGAAHHEFVPVTPNVGAAERHDKTLTGAQREALIAGLTADDPCALKSGRVGIPDEARVRVALFLPGRRCQVELWDGEWTEQRRGRAIARVIELLRAP